MLELYTTNTPNGQRAVVVLEELGLPYTMHKLDILAGEAKKPEFMKINPHGRLPVLIDPQGPGGTPITVTQSWMICVYLAEKTGRLLPHNPVQRVHAMEWMFHIGTDFQMVHTTQNTLIRFVPEKVPSIISWYEDRVREALAYIDQRLADREYLAGELSIADLAFYTLYNRRRAMVAESGGMPNLLRWGTAMDARPACRAGIDLLA